MEEDRIDVSSSDEDFVMTSSSTKKRKKAPPATKRGAKSPGRGAGQTTPRKRAKAGDPAVASQPPPAILDIEDLGKTCAFGADQVGSFRRALLDWYDEHQRTLPWRRKHTIDADGQVVPQETDEEEMDVGYGVWVSEIMLQQTRVETVIEYYKKWMKKWPTPHALANASLEEVNEAWTGLGYYRRAKFLHEGAKALVRQHDGRLPRTAAELRKIPGIGPYTAGAIASIAYDQAAPLVDGNVIRVLSRLRAIKADSTNKKVVDLFWKLAGDLVDPKRPGCFNQAMMELGATVCTPKSPKCKECPVSSHCLALAEELKARSDGAASAVSVTQYPYKPPKAKQREESVVVCVLERRQIGNSEGDDNNQSDSGRSSFLLVRRPDSGLLASLWDFPSVNLGAKKNTESDDYDGVPRVQARRAIDSYLARLLSDDHPVCRAIKSDKEEEKDTKKEKGSSVIKVERTDVGQATFLFSHIKHFYDVEWIRITDATSPGDDDSAHWQPPAQAMAATTKRKEPPNKKAKTKTTTKVKAKRKRKDDEEDDEEEQEQQEGEAVMRWLSEEELKGAAIPKGMKNCFALVEASRRRKTPTTPERRKASANTSRTKQRSIAAFFNKKP